MRPSVGWSPNWRPRARPIITVLDEGRPRVIRDIVRHSQAVVMAYLPGMEGGRAIADVLFGAVNPSGRLPVSYPRFPNGYTTYDYKAAENLEGNRVEPEFEFGSGSSYTTFEYSGLKLSGDALSHAGTLTVSVNVKNSGSRQRKEVVQLYVSQLCRSISPPNKELKGFRKIDLRAGETSAVTFTLSAADLAFVGLNNTWVTEPGRFRVKVGQLTKEFTLE